MAKERFLSFMKEIYYDMVDKNGNIRVIPIGLVGKRNLPNENLKLLEQLIRLIMDTNIVTQETKIYISDVYITMAGVNRVINEMRKEKRLKKVKKTNTSSKIQYDQNKLEKIFGNDFFYNVLSSNKNIEKYKKIIAHQFMRYSNSDKIRENLLINIPRDYMVTELSEEEFEEFLSIIAPYTKRQVKFIENNLNKNACGYFNYLLNMPSLKGIDKERSAVLKTLLDYTENDN